MPSTFLITDYDCKHLLASLYRLILTTPLSYFVVVASQISFVKNSILSVATFFSQTTSGCLFRLMIMTLHFSSIQRLIHLLTSTHLYRFYFTEYALSQVHRSYRLMIRNSLFLPLFAQTASENQSTMHLLTSSCIYRVSF